MILGFDIGGTKSAVILAEANEDGIKFFDRREIKTTGDWRAVLEELSLSGEEMLSRYNTLGKDFKIGISCGGPLDADRGIILSPPNLPGWDAVPIADYFEARFKAEAKLQNDADACALAEWKYGAGKGTRHMIFLTFGTGLGAGMILNGKLYRGVSNMAGEVGHIRLTDDGPIGYGKRGSFEGYCSGGGIAQIAKKRAKELLSEGKKASYVKQSFEDITAKDVAIAAEKGYEDALEVLRISGRYFGKGLSILIDILNPEIIVAGSIYARSGHLFKEEMEEEINKESLSYSRNACRILPAKLGESIGDYGAVVAALGEQ